MSARHELLPLTLPVLLCVGAWGLILARPAARAHVVPQPRSRVEAPRTQRRPPSPAPLNPVETAETAETEATTEAAATPEAAPAAIRAATPDSSTVIEALTMDISGESGGGSDFEYDEDSWRWSPSGLAWSRRYFYHRRDAEGRYRAWREARRRRQTGALAAGSAMTAATQDDPPSLCEVFGAACASPSTARAVTPSPAEPIPATLRREGRRWTLTNAQVETMIDPDTLCTMAVRRLTLGRDELPPITFATPTLSLCNVHETVAPDTGSPQGAVAVAVTWRGNGWWQQAIVSLRDGGVSPEASITRVVREGASVTTEVSNLTASPLTWTLGGRDHTVSPRAVLHLSS